MKYLILVLMIGVLNGCSYTRKFFDQDANVAGVGTNIEAVFEEINLSKLLDPENLGKYAPNISEGEKIDIAFHTFVQKYPASSLKLRRNALQEHLLAASTQRCNYFKHKLVFKRGNTNFFLGSFATIAGAAGAVVTGVDGSRVLSAISAIISGVRAEYNQELFANLANQVIMKGIDLRRREVYNEISLQGQSKSYELYNVEASVKDAIYFHGLCNIVVGLEAAEVAVETIEDPGIDRANKILAKLSITKKLLDNKLTPQETVKIYNTTTNLLSVGTPLVPVKTASSPFVDLVQGVEDSILYSKELKDALNKLDDLVVSSTNKTKLIKEIDLAENHIVTVFNKCKSEASIKTQQLEFARIKYINTKNRNLYSPSEEVSALFEKESYEGDANKISSEIKRVFSFYKLYVDKVKELLQQKPVAPQNVINTLSKIKSISQNSTICI